MRQIATALFKHVTTLFNRNSFRLLLSNAAKYIAAADSILKSMYPKLFRVMRVVRLLHNCAMKVKFHSKKVDQLFAKVKSTTVKHKSRQANFVTIGCPPQPVATR